MSQNFPLLRRKADACGFYGSSSSNMTIFSQDVALRQLTLITLRRYFTSFWNDLIVWTMSFHYCLAKKDLFYASNKGLEKHIQLKIISNTKCEIRTKWWDIEKCKTNAVLVVLRKFRQFLAWHTVPCSIWIDFERLSAPELHYREVGR